VAEGAPVAPLAIDRHPSGSLWGIEGRRHRLWSADAVGDTLRPAAGGEGDATGRFASRVFARSGLKVFALDPWDSRIDRYDLRGVREASLDVSVGPEDRVEAIDFCLSRSGDLYVLDRTRGDVLQFDDRGRYVGVRAAAEATGVHAPVALEIDGHGRLYLLDANPPGVLRLETDGRITRRPLSAGEARVRPAALAVDPWGTAFVGDRFAECVWVVPEGGEAVWRIAFEGAPLKPTDLAADGRTLWVADAGGACIWVVSLRYATREGSDAGDGSRR
jgi:hypothetical protein